ncbi:hypothetical protein MMC17_006028 [Xylographa soralifera]|nr:hypothetical protein [Xylographa soralifera]
MENQTPQSQSSESTRSVVTRNEANLPGSTIRPPTLVSGMSFLQRHRLRRRRDEENALAESLNTVQDAVDRLTEASSNLSSLLDEPIPRILTPNLVTDEYSGEAEVNRSRAKRRKTDSGGMSPITKYGFRGRVVPGPLQMRIASCDGGCITDPPGARMIRHYWPENVLQNNKSVYCTASSECNIVYRHAGRTPFCLKKVVIKAPKAGFDAPIQEGMVFVSMTSENLLKRTSHYRLREPTPPILPSSRVPLDDRGEATINRIPLYDYNFTRSGHAHLAQDSAHNRPPSRRAAYPSAQVIPMSNSNDGATGSRRNIHGMEDRANHAMDSPNPVFPLIDLGDSSTSPPRTISPPIAPLFNVEMSCDDPSDDEEEESSAGVLADLADRCRREYPPLSSSSSEDDEEDGGHSHTLRRRIRALRATPRKIEWSTSIIPSNEVGDLKPKIEILAPHAKFFIESKSGTVSIKFDPPV